MSGEDDKSDTDDAPISSARGMTPNPTTKSSGNWSLAELRLSESTARELLLRHFTAYGARIEHDYHFHVGSVLCTLDGYDPEIRVGYTFISHSDRDVITDVDEHTEAALREMAADGRCFIMVVHDDRTFSADRLVAEADAFLGAIPSSDDLRSR